MTYQSESQAAGRHVLPDLIRAFALFGIVVVNVAYFAWPGEITYHDGGLSTATDQAAYFGVNSLFLFKAYSLFSLMFGVGLGYQMMSAQRRGVAFGARYTRRLLGLLILGILHVTLAFVGDILIIYAVFGAILYLFRKRPVKSLMRWGIALLVFQILLSLFFTFMLKMGETHAPEEMQTALTEMMAGLPVQYETYGSGNFAEIAARRWQDWVGYLIFALPLQGPGVLAFFLIGLASVKSGALSDPHAKIWSRGRRFALPLGLLISGVGAYLMNQNHNPMSGDAMLSMSLILIGAPLSTWGYMGWIAKWAAQPTSALKTFLARGGTASLTAYLMQSAILSFIFCGYGLGYFGQIGAAGCILIAAVTGLVTISAVSLWRTKFARGPFEYLLRWFTYGGRKRANAELKRLTLESGDQAQ